MTLLARVCLMTSLAALSACASMNTPKLLNEADPEDATNRCSLSSVANNALGQLKTTQSCVESLIASYVSHARDLDQQRIGYDVALIGLLSATTGAELFSAHRDVAKGLGLASATIGTGKNYSNSAKAAVALRGGAARLQCALRETAKLQQATQSYIRGYDNMQSARTKVTVTNDELEHLLESCQATTAYSYTSYANAYKSTVNEDKLAQGLHSVASAISARTIDDFLGTHGDEAGLSSKFEALAKKFQAAEQQAQTMQGAAQIAAKSADPNVTDAVAAAEAMLPAVRDAAVADITLEACANL